MIRYLKHNEIDRKKWDACIDHSLNGLIYTRSWYLDIVCPGWEALVEGDYTSVMPLTCGKKYGMHYLYPPYFAQQLGIFSKEEISEEKAEEFLRSIPVRFKFIEIHLNTANTFEYPGFQVKRNTNIELALEGSYITLHRKFSEDIKRNIKKAGKHNVVLNKKIAPAALIRLFRNNTGKKISNLSGKNYKTLLHLIEACIKKGHAEVWGAFMNDKLCAGVVLVKNNDRTIFLFSATDAAAKRSGAMHFLIDTFIRENAGKKMILDFEGSNIPSLARFYKGFGSAETVYLQVRKNELPKLVRWVKEIK